MAKGSRKRALRYEKDQSGCMWGLINIFDFRHGRPSQKLLADKKRGSRRIAGAAFPSDELSKLEDSCRFSKEADAGEQCETATGDKLSVKELMEEEMFKQHSNTDVDLKQTVSDQQGHQRKNHWRTNKKSFDLNDSHVISEKPTHRKHKSLSSLDVTGMMAELCSQVQVKDIDCLNHDQTISVPPKEDPSITEEKLGEAAKVFVSYFVDGKNAKEGKIQPSGELMGALQILNSNKDMFLKLLQDPGSQLMKHIQRLEDHRVCADEKSKVQAESDLLERGKSKRQGFFWRRFKGPDGNLSKKSEHPEDVSTIVVLKPVQNERASSHFFFTEFTRKLKLAMRKEQPDKAVGGESLGMASSSRNHFFIEKIPKSSVSTKKGDKAGRSHEANSIPEQRISNIYAEAKKHLAEIIGNSDVDVNFLSREVPSSLGRILSYSDYSSSPIYSPRKDGQDSLALSGKDSESGNEITAQRKQEKNVDHADLANNEPCATEETNDNLEVPKDEYDLLHSAVHVIHDEGVDAETKTPDDTELEIRISSDSSSELCNTFTCRNEQEQAEETPEDSKEEQTMCLNLDVVLENQASSPSTSSSVCSRTEDFEDPDTITDRSERRSPISVLEPVFKEDDVSPPSVKSLPVAEFIQPRQIKFEDQISPAPRPRTRDEERNSVLEFVKTVVRASGVTQDQLLERFLFSDHLLDPSLFDQVDFLPDHVCYDPKLLFDLIDEVLVEVCGRDFDGIPSFYRPYLQLKRKDIVDGIWEGVDWHLESEHMQHTLDQTVAKDFSKSWTWMDLRNDCENIGSEMEEDIFEELVEDTVMSLVEELS